MMDSLHDVLRSIRPEVKSRNHVSVFRQFLAHLDQLQRKAERGVAKVPTRRKVERRGK